MSTLRRLLFFAILCFGLQVTIGRKRKVVHHSYTEPWGDFNLRVNSNTFRSSNNNKNYTNIICHSIVCPAEHRHKVEKKCTVASCTKPGTTCSVTLKTVQPYVIDDFIEVFPFGPEKVIIFWDDSRKFVYKMGNIKCTIVNLTTCQSKSIELPFTSMGYYFRYYYLLGKSNYVIHEDSLEFITKSSDDPKYLNKYHIDTEGNLLSKLEPWCKNNKEINNEYPTVVNLEMKSYVYTSWRRDPDNDNRLWRQIILSKCNGSEKLLKEFLYTAHTIEEISTSQNSIVVATNGNGLIDVDQFDLDGNLKLNVKFNIEFSVEDMALLNLADGGFIIIVGGYEHITSSIPSQRLKMLKISGNQKTIRSVRNVEATPCPYTSPKQMTLQLFENEAKKYCMTFLCSNVASYNNAEKPIKGKNFAELLVKCYANDEFTVKIPSL